MSSGGGVVVLLEDAAARVGLLLAPVGVGLATASGEPVWDRIGTLAGGVLLIFVAIVPMIETTSLLLGGSAAPAQVRGQRDSVGGGGRRARDISTHDASGSGRAAGGCEARDARE